MTLLISSRTIFWLVWSFTKLYFNSGNGCQELFWHRSGSFEISFLFVFWYKDNKCGIHLALIFTRPRSSLRILNTEIWLISVSSASSMTFGHQLASMEVVSAPNFASFTISYTCFLEKYFFPKYLSTVSKIADTECLPWAMMLTNPRISFFSMARLVPKSWMLSWDRLTGSFSG